MTAPTPWLFFDFDNTLMGTEAISVPSLVERFNTLYAEKIGRNLELDEFFTHFQGQVRETLTANLSAYFNIHVDTDLLYQDREWNMMQYLQKTRVPMAPNVIEALTVLKRHGARFAVVSNNTIMRYMASMRYADNNRGEELAAYFGTHLFEAGDVHKPKPDVFLRAIAQTNADVKQACAVEDSPTGARAALGAGLKTFGYLGYADHPDVREKELLNLGVTECFKDWADFPALWLRHANR